MAFDHPGVDEEDGRVVFGGALDGLEVADGRIMVEGVRTCSE